jgi:hypothetical protein
VEIYNIFSLRQRDSPLVILGCTESDIASGISNTRVFKSLYNALQIVGRTVVGYNNFKIIDRLDQAQSDGRL